MFREMRRSKQMLSADYCVEVLKRCTNGILACSGDDGYPYAVPLSYVYSKGSIYFHSAKAGHKIDAIARDSKVSFAVVDEDRVVSKEYTSYFRSIIAFGRARIVEGNEWNEAFKALVEKYSGDQPETDKHKAISDCKHSCIFAIYIEHMTGKEAIELANAARLF